MAEFGTATIPEIMWTFLAFIGVLSSSWVSYDSLKDLLALFGMPYDLVQIKLLIAWYNLMSSVGIGLVLLMLFVAGLYSCLLPTNPTAASDEMVLVIIQLCYTIMDLILMAIPLSGTLIRWRIRSMAFDSIEQINIRKIVVETYSGPDRRKSSDREG